MTPKTERHLCEVLNALQEAVQRLQAQQEEIFRLTVGDDIVFENKDSRGVLHHIRKPAESKCRAIILYEETTND